MQLYIQKNTEIQECPPRTLCDYQPRYLYQNPETKHWFIGNEPGHEPTAKLRNFNTGTNGAVPTSGWQVSIKLGHTKRDPSLTVVQSAFSACAPIRIFGFGSNAKRWQEKFGEYRQTERWYNGHPIYQKLGGEDLLKMMNYGAWGIGKGIGYNTDRLAGFPAYKSPTESENWHSALGEGPYRNRPNFGFHDKIGVEPAHVIAQCA